MNKRDREKAEAWEAMLPHLKACARKRGGATLQITAHEHKPSSSGIACYFDVEVLSTDSRNGKPGRSAWLSLLLCRALGYRFNERRECISMGGYGYCRATQVANDIARKLGKPIYVQSTGFAFGPRGWVGRERRAKN